MSIVFNGCNTLNFFSVMSRFGYRMVPLLRSARTAVTQNIQTKDKLMKIKKARKLRRSLTAIAVLTGLCLSLVACDNGELDTFANVNQLTSEPLENPNQHVFLNAASGWQEPVYVCFYSFNPDTLQTTTLTATPLGALDNQEGIPFGEFTVVEAPPTPEGEKLDYAFVKNASVDCSLMEDPTDIYLSDEPSELFDFLNWDVVYIRTDNNSFAYNVLAMYERMDDIIDVANWSSEHQLKQMTPASGKTAINFYLDVYQGIWPYHKLTVCWDPDNEGAAPSQTLIQLDSVNSKEGEFAPITSGTIHLHYDYINCATADYTTALASLEVPFSQGPDTNLSFDADSAASMFIFGGDLARTDPEDAFTILPLLH